MHTVNATTIGDSLKVVIPKAMLQHLKLTGDDYFQIEYTSTGIRLTLCDAELAGQLKGVEKVMEEDREVLRKLAE
ncbi:MAG: hypothetical protein SH868_13930 [Bythopirellula sp.]|nr:hypothetical protein [Bythopirellula sp.]